MTSDLNFYAIYDADRSLMGELRYALNKCLGRAECALCDLSHGWNLMGRSVWRRRTGVAASLHWVHRDELPRHIINQVSEHLPCVAVERSGNIEILIHRDALQGCEGDFNVFEHLLEQKVRALHPQPAPIADGE